MHQLRVEGDLHAVTGDRKQVIVVLCSSGTDALAADAEFFDLLDLFRRGWHCDMDLLAIGNLEVHGLLRDDIRKGSIALMSSGRLWNFVKRCFNWKPLPRA